MLAIGLPRGARPVSPLWYPCGSLVDVALRVMVAALPWFAAVPSRYSEKMSSPTQELERPPQQVDRQVATILREVLRGCANSRHGYRLDPSDAVIAVLIRYGLLVISQGGVASSTRKARQMLSVAPVPGPTSDDERLAKLIRVRLSKRRQKFPLE
jgi:hypothetical protein